ncbi:tudor domain-containing protein 3 [Bacillus rossius redtenbacheri]|uniref:tudor domain-containing protein 3 n=1 Tax=Bacillus rossius redtenbacheri TaxID=93214 RepID=UPI002FDE1E88
MALADKLKEQGWHLTEEGVDQLSEKGAVSDVKQLVSRALDIDLRDIGGGAFPEDMHKNKLDSIPGRVVVQVQKVRNVSAPRSNEESKAAPRMLKLSLTDGQLVCHAVEVEHMPFMSLNTPPGTKLFLKVDTVPVAHGFLLLRPSLVDLLGGKVLPLVDKWELNRSLAKCTRGRIGEEGGPPPWIPFGQKILYLNSQDLLFHSSLEGGKDSKENAEFEAQRKDAIAEAARGGSRRVFKGGNKQLLDHNLQQIVELGYSSEQAEYALRQSKNNVDRALRSLQRRDEGKRADAKAKGEEPRDRRKRGDKDDEAGGAAPKPSGNVSLFDFLQNKLPVQNDKDHEPHGGAVNSHGSSDKKHPGAEQSPRCASAGKGGRAERGARGSREGKGARGGRGSGGVAPSWGDSPGACHPAHRDDKARAVVATPIQRPPRFQNQQRQQQSDTAFGQPWANCYENMYNMGTWPSRGVPPPPPGKPPARQHLGFGGDFDNHLPPPGPRYARQDSPVSRYGGFPDHFPRGVYGMDYSFKEPPPVLSPPAHFSGAGLYRSHAADYIVPEPPPASQFLPDTKTWHWQKGDKCMAKYWEDNMYYNAEVTGVSERTCVVRFTEYGNFEEVLQADCIPFTEAFEDVGKLTKPDVFNYHL